MLRVQGSCKRATSTVIIWVISTMNLQVPPKILQRLGLLAWGFLLELLPIAIRRMSGARFRGRSDRRVGFRDLEDAP